MTQQIDKIQGLISELKAEKNRTHFLDVAQGGLRTAVEQLGLHGKELERRAAGVGAEIDAKEKELAALKAGSPEPKVLSPKS